MEHLNCCRPVQRNSGSTKKEKCILEAQYLSFHRMSDKQSNASYSKKKKPRGSEALADMAHLVLEKKQKNIDTFIKKNLKKKMCFSMEDLSEVSKGLCPKYDQSCNFIG